MWPTHRAKTRQAQNLKLWRKKKNRRLRRLDEAKRVIEYV